MKLSAQNKILMFLQCAQCVEDIKAGRAKGESPRSYGRLEAGWTQEGLQIRCVRHGLNVVHIDFEGHKHAANVNGGEPEP
jgi:hypothetical protein